MNNLIDGTSYKLAPAGGGTKQFRPGVADGSVDFSKDPKIGEKYGTTLLKETNYTFISHTHNYSTKFVFGQNAPLRDKIPSIPDKKTLFNSEYQSGQAFDWENNAVFLFNKDQKKSIKMDMDIYFKSFTHPSNGILY